MRHAQALLRVAGDSPLPLRALACFASVVRAVPGPFRGRRGRCASARVEEANGRADTGAMRGHMLALTAFLMRSQATRQPPSKSRASACALLQAGYGARGRYLMLLLAARIASIGEDAQALRDMLDADARR